MHKVETPQSEEEFEAYFDFRWQMLGSPWNFPKGSERDEYESVSEHRFIRDQNGEVIAVGRLHFNTPEEAQVRHIAVSNDLRSKGLGKLIVSALEAVARANGVQRIVTNSRDTSIEFFESCGYEVDGNPTVELGVLNRQQMIKRLTEMNAIMLHPAWCSELQKTWHETIPITEQMGIKLFQYSGRTLEARASLNKNVNLHGTMFAGSIFSLATLTGWGMIFLQLKQLGRDGDIVLGDADIHYHKPLTLTPRAVCNIETLSAKFAVLDKGKKCNVKLQVDILDGDTPVAEFKGIYWVLPPRKEE
ncbi:GNAT family N-acetyltransferase [Alteromonadaceae bacterium M269]|nr:GNAT family N-acetyltransferase [Alteromonadaceae bacterium M269]